jgi:hypothetical protein
LSGTPVYNIFATLANCKTMCDRAPSCSAISRDNGSTDTSVNGQCYFYNTTSPLSSSTTYSAYLRS